MDIAVLLIVLCVHQGSQLNSSVTSLIYTHLHLNSPPITIRKIQSKSNTLHYDTTTTYHYSTPVKHAMPDTKRNNVYNPKI